VGLIAICHVNGELGSYIVWLVVGAGPMMQVRKASAVLTAEAVMLAASVVMAPALAETPWLMLPFVFVFMAASTFITVSRKLGSAGLIQVVSLASFYGVVFAPGLDTLNRDATSIDPRDPHRRVSFRRISIAVISVGGATERGARTCELSAKRHVGSNRDAEPIKKAPIDATTAIFIPCIVPSLTYRSSKLRFVVPAGTVRTLEA